MTRSRLRKSAEVRAQTRRKPCGSVFAEVPEVGAQRGGIPRGSRAEVLRKCVPHTPIRIRAAVAGANAYPWDACAAPIVARAIAAHAHTISPSAREASAAAPMPHPAAQE
jgi:hypothetical protein